METRFLIDYLINGILIEMLKTARMHHSVAWIVQGQTTIAENTTETRFWLFYGDVRPNFQHALGGNAIPTDALNCDTIDAEKRQEVIDYLTVTMALTEEQAVRVVDNAHEWQPRS